MNLNQFQFKKKFFYNYKIINFLYENEKNYYEIINMNINF